MAPDLIHRNQQSFGAPNIRFQLSPPRLADIPAFDLLLVKDVLQHLSSAEISEFMRDVVPRFRYALITNCVEPEKNLNREICAGEFRPLDLRRPPFSFAAQEVYSFSGLRSFSWKKLKGYPAWHKIVLLFSQDRGPVAGQAS